MNKIFSVITFCLLSTYVYSQTSTINTGPNIPSDSLTLDYVVSEVIKTHPSIKESEEGIRESDARISLAKTGYYPDVDFTGNYTRIGPVSTFDVPGLGNYKLFPENNYSISLNVNENIFDFGKTSKNVDLANESKVLAQENLNLTQQNLSLRTISVFFAISYLQDAIAIKDEQLSDLRQHLDFVTKKRETGSATQYEILSTQVRMSAVESQKIDLETSLNVQRSMLGSLMGLPASSQYNVKRDETEVSVGVQEDSLISYSIKHRDEMQIAKEKSVLSEMHYNVLKTTNYPVINLFASGGWKNGYIPNLNTFTANFAAGIGVTLPIFDAGRNRNNLLLAKSTILENDLEAELIRRKIQDDVVRSEENLRAAQKKVDQFTLQLSQAEEAYNLAQANYKAGAITNLDLLDASTNVSESRLMLLKVRIDYIVSVYGLKAALGQKLY